MSKEISNRYQGETHQGSDRTAPYPVSRMAPATELVDMAQEIATADNMLSTNAHGKLKLIADQIRALQAEAHHVLESTRRDQQLHRAKCHFKRQPGHIYHLYTKKGEDYFSMLSPQEWGRTSPHDYIGSFRLENDMSWTPVEEIAQHDKKDEVIQALIQKS